MIDGWPIAHHVFGGNKRDSVTVPQVLDDLQKRFGLRRVVFVGDRGMVTSDNIELLRSREQGYVAGLNRRRRPEVLRYVVRATGPWLGCPAGIAASEKAMARVRAALESLAQRVNTGKLKAPEKFLPSVRSFTRFGSHSAPEIGDISRSLPSHSGHPHSAPQKQLPIIHSGCVARLDVQTLA